MRTEPGMLHHRLDTRLHTGRSGTGRSSLRNGQRVRRRRDLHRPEDRLFVPQVLLEQRRLHGPGWHLLLHDQRRHGGHGPQREDVLAELRSDDERRLQRHGARLPSGDRHGNHADVHLLSRVGSRRTRRFLQHEWSGRLHARVWLLHHRAGYEHVPSLVQGALPVVSRRSLQRAEPADDHWRHAVRSLSLIEVRRPS